MRTFVFLLGAAMVLAGCAAPADAPDDPQDVVEDVVALPDKIILEVEDLMTFRESVVDAAVKFTNDLYEPTMEVSDTGVIYVTGHTILVDTTGAPVFFSKDDGATWDQLPFLGPASIDTVHGATPPPSDEIFLVAGDNGQLWGVDITLLTFPVNGWCDDGAELCYHNPNAYDEAQAQTTRVDAIAGESSSCSVANLNDRPWAAYGDGKLLMVNNPGGGPVQVGLMDVPPAAPIGGPQLGVADMGEWNLCAGEGGGAIPGIPDMRPDHFFAVPQVQGDKLVIVKGHGDVFDVEQVTVFNNTNVNPSGGGTSNYGQVVFDAKGTMFVGIRNNTVHHGADGRASVGDGQLHVAISTDDGETFIERTFKTSKPTNSIYMDGYKQGQGALLSWGEKDEAGTDWYAGHLTIGPDGGPVLSNISLVLDDGPAPSAHVQGASVGPDGRVYLVMDYGGGVGDLPLRVMVQDDGPTLPGLVEVTVVAAEA